jgi:hypothetical protein
VDTSISTTDPSGDRIKNVVWTEPGLDAVSEHTSGPRRN